MSATALPVPLQVALFFAAILGLGWCVGVFQDWRETRRWRKQGGRWWWENDDDHPTTEPRQDRGETHGGSDPSAKP